MKTFALRDENDDSGRDLAILECYGRQRAFYFELPPNADPWDLPFILHEFAQRGAHTIGSEWSGNWARSRLVPTERQNIGEVLRESGLEEYDELCLIQLTGGRCSQDSCHLVPVSGGMLPGWYVERLGERMRDAFAVTGNRLVAVMANDDAVLCPMEQALAGRRAFSRVLSDEELFRRVRLQPGGHGVCWGDSLQVSVEELARAGEVLPLSGRDLALLAGQALCDTSEAASLLACSRQNVSDLVRRGRLDPAKVSPGGQLFLRADVLLRG